MPGRCHGSPCWTFHCQLIEMQAHSKIDMSQTAPDTLHVEVSGPWQMSGRRPDPETVISRLEADFGIKNLILDASRLTGWDSSFLTFIRVVTRYCRKKNIVLDLQGAPAGVQGLLHLAAVVSAQADASRHKTGKSFFYMVGDSAVHFATSTLDMLSFIGEATLSLVKFFLGRARFRRTDLLIFIEECGADSLPIVTLISVLVGLILAFVGAVQLKLFGAHIYVANLVAIAMVREMGALMTGIIMSGRIGAAYAAQLGTMQVNEEIDALITMGISPVDFLVLPRMLAMVLMMPLLALYSDLLGILGGAIVGVGVMDITVIQYITQTQTTLDLTNISLGIAKAGIYAIIIALSGCLRGMQSGRSAAAVGEATTSAVVTAIVGIIVTDGIFAVLCNALGI